MTVSEKNDAGAPPRTIPKDDGSPSSNGRPGGVRADIQALRALAVVLVVVYHFFPGRVPGGFIGVDVFFVISGFLITGHLISKPPRTGRQLAEFWGRRIRRLLPASFIVLGVTTLVTLLWAPQTIWAGAAKQIAASALYVENWFLAAQAVDYLAADAAASPVQHFWSLSVEEQFYLVWPVVVLVAIWLMGRRAQGMDRVAVGAAISVIVVGSFAASIWITTTDPSAAYFVSWTRAWELGLGGLAACAFPWTQRRMGTHPWVRDVIAYAGFALIAYAAFAFTGSTPFPGAAAAIPVLGTALVIVAAVERGKMSPLRPMSWKPVQLVGDVSYSMYLWHWPALILLPYLLGHDLHRTAKVLAILLAFGLAWLSKVLVEDRFRGRKPLGVPLRRSYVFGATGMVVFALIAGVIVGHVNARAAAAQESLAGAAQNGASCFGSRALVNTDHCAPHGDELLTDPVAAQTDKPAPYTDGCWVLGDYSAQKTCHYGSDAADARRVALVGNSHAGHWLPALQEIAKTQKWSITTYLISECFTVDELIRFETPQKSRNCLDWNRRVIRSIENGHYDLVVFSNRTARAFPGMNRRQTLVEAESAYGRVLTKWVDTGTPILVLRDTPYAVELDNVPDCVSEHQEDLSACDGGVSRKQPDPLAEAAAEMSAPNLDVLDLTDRICKGETCYSVVGGVIVYFDRGHLSATFSRSLVPDIASAAETLMTRSRAR